MITRPFQKGRPEQVKKLNLLDFRSDFEKNLKKHQNRGSAVQLPVELNVQLKLSGFLS